MSIWASWAGIDDPHYYAGSHVMPEDNDWRAGHIHLAVLNAGVRHDRYCREDRCDHPERAWNVYEPYLRMGMASEKFTDATLILDEEQVQRLRDKLTKWLELPKTRMQPSQDQR